MSELYRPEPRPSELEQARAELDADEPEVSQAEGFAAIAETRRRLEEARQAKR